MSQQASRRIALTALTILFIGLGCRSKPEPPPQTPAAAAYWRVNPAGVSSEADTLNMLVWNLQNAPDSAAEAEAMRQLHKWEVDHQLTYTMRAVRVDTNTTVNNPTVQQYPLRVDVSIFRGQQPINTFSFVPRDNRNLALMGS